LRQFATGILQSIERDFLRLGHPRPMIVRPSHELEAIQAAQNYVARDVPFISQNLTRCGFYGLGRNAFDLYRYRPSHLERAAASRFKAAKLDFVRHQEIARWS